MSFNTLARRVANETLSISQRHVALRGYVERFCPLGFNETWNLLEARFGLKQGRPSDSKALANAIRFLHSWRQAWLKRQAGEAELRKTEKRLRIPRPKARDAGLDNPKA